MKLLIRLNSRAADLCLCFSYMEKAGFLLMLVKGKPVYGVSIQVRHKPGYAATEDGLKNIMAQETRYIIESMLQKTKVLISLHSSKADLCICSHLVKAGFFMMHIF